MQLILKTFISTLFLSTLTQTTKAQDSDLPFAGGIGNGNANGISIGSLCAIGGNYNIHSGGISNGFSSVSLIVSNCEVVMPINPFNGSIGNGFANAILSDKSCPSLAGYNVYSGGAKSGFAHFRRIFWNCDGLNSTIINVNPLEVCQGDSILITGTLLSNIEYVEFTGALTNQFLVIDDTQVRSLVPIGAQSGFVGVTGPNGTTAGTAQIEITPIPFANFTSEQTQGLTFNFTSSNPASVNHFWDFGDGSTSTQQNPTHTYSVEGIYDVTLSVSNECGNDESKEELTAINVGIISSLEPNVKIYPNPFKSQINLEILLNTQENIKINIYNLMGQLLWSENISGQREIFRTVDLDAFAKGIYFINIQSSSQIISRKIVKQ